MEKNMRNKSQLNPVQLITADLWIDFFAQHFNEPPQNVAFAESEIRIDDFWALFPDFVTFLRSTRNYLIISCDYFYSGDAMRNE